MCVYVVCVSQHICVCVRAFLFPVCMSPYVYLCIYSNVCIRVCDSVLRCEYPGARCERILTKKASRCHGEKVSYQLHFFEMYRMFSHKAHLTKYVYILQHVKSIPVCFQHTKPASGSLTHLHFSIYDQEWIS